MVIVWYTMAFDFDNYNTDYSNVNSMGFRLVSRGMLVGSAPTLTTRLHVAILGA